MTINQIQELSGINADLCKTDIIYAFEVANQYVHNKFNQHLESILDKDILDRLIKDRDNTHYKVGRVHVTADLEAELDQFLSNEVNTVNKGLGGVFTETQVRGMLTHLKALLMPLDLPLGFVWLARFDNQVLNPSSFDQCVTALGLRMWFRSTQKREFTPAVLQAFREELEEEMLGLASLMKMHVHYGFIRILAGKFMIDLQKMSKGNMPKDSKNTLLYRKPSYLSTDYPKVFFDTLLSSLTNLFINNDADKLNFPTISTFIREDESLWENGSFPQIKFRQWMTKQQDQYAPTLFSHLIHVPPIKKLKLEKDMFVLTHLPCGAYFQISSIGISNFFLDLVKTTHITDSEERIFANTFLDVFVDNYDVWVAVAVNVIRNFTSFGETLPKTLSEANQTLAPVALIQLIGMMGFAKSKRDHKEARQIIDEAMVHIYSIEMCKVEKEMYENLERKYGNKVDQKAFLEMNAKSVS